LELETEPPTQIAEGKKKKKRSQIRQQRMNALILATIACAISICDAQISFRMPFKCGSVVRVTQDGKAVRFFFFFFFFFPN
jgi:hypothetical protein